MHLRFALSILRLCGRYAVLIHSPHTGGDEDEYDMVISACVFQSTHPVRSKTAEQHMIIICVVPYAWCYHTSPNGVFSGNRISRKNAGV